MNQLQFNGKTSTKRPNSSASSYGAETQKKTRSVLQTPRLILPKPVNHNHKILFFNLNNKNLALFNKKVH